jgi:hypothetical protein
MKIQTQAFPKTLTPSQSAVSRWQIVPLMVVIAGAAGLGVWSEVKAAGAARAKKVLTRSLHVAVHPQGAYAQLGILQQPSGAFWTHAQVFAGNQLVTSADWSGKGDVTVNTTDANPYAKAAFSGTATSWTDIDAGWNGTPVTLDVGLLAQPGATWNFSGPFTHSGIVTDDAALAWDRTRAAQISTSGNEAVTFTGGSATVMVDGQTILQAGGGSAHLQENTSHTVQVLQP